MSGLLRLDDDTKRHVDALAFDTGQTRQRVVAEALDAYERDRFWNAFHARYAEIAADPEAAREFNAEREAEAGALSDGLDR